MKKSVKIFSLIITIALFAIACGNNTNTPTHTHEDGSIHEGEDHFNNTEETSKQESFTVEADSLATKTETTHKDHDHNHDHPHSHKH